MRSRCLIVCALVAAAFVVNGCVYYNTFFNAKKAYQDAERARLQQERNLQRPGTGEPTSPYSPSAPPSRTPSRSSPISNAQLYRTAIEKSAKVLAYYPRSEYVDDALLLMAKSYYRLNEFGSSLRKCDELLTSFPQSPLAVEARYWRGMSLWSLGKQEEAAALLQQIADEQGSPFRGNAAFALAGLERERGALDGAIEYYRIAIMSAEDPLFRAQAREALGECLMQAKRPREAVSVYSELALVSPTSIERYHAYMKKAAAQREMKDYDGALATLQPLVRDQRYDAYIPQTSLEIARTYEEKGETEAAVLLYQKVLDDAARELPSVPQTGQMEGRQFQAAPSPQNKETAEAHYRLGLLQERHYHNYAKATEHYTSAAQNQTFEVSQSAKQHLDALTRWSQLHAALTDTSDSTKSQGRDLAVYALAEHFFLNLEEVDSAFAYFQTVVDSFPESSLRPKAHYAMGWLWQNARGDSVRADSVWSLVLADTTPTPLVHELQRAIRKQRDSGTPDPVLPFYREAETAWLRALDELPPYAPDTLADSLALAEWWRRWAEEQGRMSGNYVPTFEKIVEEHPNSPYAAKARFVLGWTAENIRGDTTAAFEWYRAASNDSLASPEIAARARKLLDLRIPKAEPSKPDSLGPAERTRRSARPDSLGLPEGTGRVVRPDSVMGESLFRKFTRDSVRTHAADSLRPGIRRPPAEEQEDGRR